MRTRYVCVIHSRLITDVCSQPARKKSKAEVMAEVIAKSKQHKVGLHVPFSSISC